MLSEIILLGIALYFLYKWVWPKVPANFPPGPTNYPVIGGALTFGKLDPVMAEAMIKLGKIYGPVTGMYLGKTLGVVINGWDTIKEVLNRDEFNGRPDTFVELFKLTIGSIERGIMFNNGENWKEQRRFTLRHLRDLGFGKSSLEGLIHEEIEECFQIVQKNVQGSHPREGVSVDNIFGVSIINVLWLVVSGKRFKHEDAEFKRILAKITQSFRAGNPTSNVIADYPFLRHLPYFSRVWEEFTAGTTAINDVLEEAVEQHKKDKKVGKNSHDFMNEYLSQLDVLKENGTAVGSSFNEKQLIAICADLFGAGAESTSNSLAFACLYMLLYPEVQAKVQAELDSVVGRGKLPSLDDRTKLPYVEAVMEEVFRISSIAPLTVPHSVMENTQLLGYTIPKNTVMMINLHSVHMDKDYWGDPEVFRPERFIDAQGKFVKSERLLPFGFGKRNCPGESLARMNYYLFFTAMMQRFKLERIPGKPKPSTIPLPGFTVAPQPFKALILSRT